MNSAKRSHFISDFYFRARFKSYASGSVVIRLCSMILLYLLMLGKYPGKVILGAIASFLESSYFISSLHTDEPHCMAPGHNLLRRIFDQSLILFRAMTLGSPFSRGSAFIVVGIGSLLVRHLRLPPTLRRQVLAGK